MIRRHLDTARAWVTDASLRAGAPPPLVLLPTLPSACPAWARAPSFAAAAALLVPLPPASGSSGDGAQGSGKLPAASVGDVAAAAEVRQRTGLTGRALWSLCDRGAFYVHGTPYPHVQGGVQHRQEQLLPMTLRHVLPPLDEQQGSGASGGSSDASAVRQQAERLFYEIAADQRPGGLRVLGYLLSHLFR